MITQSSAFIHIKKLFNVLKQIKLWTIEILFPEISLDDVRIHTTLFCARCGARLANNVKICHSQSYRLAAATKYEGAVKEYIWQMKYNCKPGAVQPLINLLARYIKNQPDFLKKIRKFVLIPMPISKERLSERKYNQALIIAEEINNILNLPILKNVLVRVKNTKPQVGLSYQQRKENVKNCFSVVDKSKVCGKNVIIVDDVFTSGSTMDEAVKTLRDAGVRQVIALVIAKR